MNNKSSSMRKLISITIVPTGRKISIFRNSDWGEWVVRFYIDGIHQAQADYHTDVRVDAYDTANKWVNQGTYTHPALVDPSRA
jgi:hypothetical protein